MMIGLESADNFFFNFNINICFWIVSRVFRLSIIKLRWYFFVYINVIGGWMFSIMI